MGIFAEHEPRDPARPRPGLPPGLEIRPAAPADVGGLARIAAERDGGAPEAHAARFASEVSRALGAGAPAASGPGERLLLAATLDGEVVAFARAGRFLRPAAASPRVAPAGWYLGGVIVAAAHRRRGIAAALTRRRLAWIAGRADEVYYFANARNRVSIDLHARFGFAELTRDFEYPGVTFAGGAGVLFRAVLRPPS